MKRLVSTLVATTLVLAACGSTSPTAATVDGNVITVKDVEALMAPDDGTVDRPTFAQFLGAAIQLDVFFSAAEAAFGIHPTDDEVATQADTIYEQNNVDQTREEFLSQVGISEELFQGIARQQLVDTAVRAELEKTVEVSEEDLADARQAAEWSTAEVCASHILVATEEEAQAVLDRLASGETFEGLAIELSTDTGSGANGGDLGCSSPSRYVQPFAEAAMAAEIDTVTAPVESEFGFHLILVNDRTEGDLASVPDDATLSAQILPFLVDEAFNVWFDEVMGSADVTVEAEYGTWDPGPPPAVTPPPA